MDVRTAMNFAQICQLSEGVGIAERNVNYSVVDKSGDAGEVGSFLATTHAGSRDEDRRILSGEFTVTPESTGGIPEGLSNIAETSTLTAENCGDQLYLPLCGHGAITSGNTKDERVVVGKIIEGENWVVGFGGRRHFSQDLGREGLGDPTTRLSAGLEPGKETYW